MELRFLNNPYMQQQNYCSMFVTNTCMYVLVKATNVNNCLIIIILLYILYIVWCFNQDVYVVSAVFSCITVLQELMLHMQSISQKQECSLGIGRLLFQELDSPLTGNSCLVNTYRVYIVLQAVDCLKELYLYIIVSYVCTVEVLTRVLM